MVTRPHLLDVPIDGRPLFALRVGATVLLADLSYRFVETPKRRGALGSAWKSFREARASRRRRLDFQWATALAPLVILCAALGVATARAEPPKPPAYLSTKHVHIETADRGTSSATMGQGDAA